MKHKILIAAVVCLALIALVRSVGKPVMAQVRAALVQNVDEPSRNAFALYQNNSTLNQYFATFNVPAGKRYVIQQYKAECDIVSSTSMTEVQVISTVGGNTSNASAPAHVVQANGFISGQQVYAYAGTGLGLARYMPTPGHRLRCSPALSRGQAAPTSRAATSGSPVTRSHLSSPVDRGSVDQLSSHLPHQTARFRIHFGPGGFLCLKFSLALGEDRA